MSRRISILAAVTLFLAAALAMAPAGNVRLRMFQEADSVVYRIQWTPPPRTNAQTPITGYDWELWLSANDSINREGGLDDRVASGLTPGPNIRRVDGSFVACPMVIHGETVTEGWIGAYVRATGDFRNEAPWGKSTAVRIACPLDDSPPGPPIVDLDTIQADTSGTAPDSLVMMPVDLGYAEWDQDPKRVRFTALSDVARMCAFAYRDGSGSLAPRDSWVTTMDSTVVTTTGVIQIAPAPPLESACWYWTAQAAGQDDVFLCTTDCGPIPRALHAMGIATPSIPKNAKYAGYGVGVLLIGFGMYRDRKKGKKA